jgi:hypothetical protein
VALSVGTMIAVTRIRHYLWQVLASLTRGWFLHSLSRGAAVDAVDGGLTWSSCPKTDRYLICSPSRYSVCALIENPPSASGESRAELRSTASVGCHEHSAARAGAFAREGDAKHTSESRGSTNRSSATQTYAA